MRTPSCIWPATATILYSHGPVQVGMGFRALGGAGSALTAVRSSAPIRHGARGQSLSDRLPTTTATWRAHLRVGLQADVSSTACNKRFAIPLNVPWLPGTSEDRKTRYRNGLSFDVEGCHDLFQRPQRPMQAN